MLQETRWRKMMRCTSIGDRLAIFSSVHKLVPSGMAEAVQLDQLRWLSEHASERYREHSGQYMAVLDGYVAKLTPPRYQIVSTVDYIVRYECSAHGVVPPGARTWPLPKDDCSPTALAALELVGALNEWERDKLSLSALTGAFDAFEASPLAAELRSAPAMARELAATSAALMLLSVTEEQA